MNLHAASFWRLVARAIIWQALVIRHRIKLLKAVQAMLDIVTKTKTADTVQAGLQALEGQAGTPSPPEGLDERAVHGSNTVLATQAAIPG